MWVLLVCFKHMFSFVFSSKTLWPSEFPGFPLQWDWIDLTILSEAQLYIIQSTGNSPQSNSDLQKLLSPQNWKSFIAGGAAKYCSNLSLLFSFAWGYLPVHTLSPTICQHSGTTLTNFGRLLTHFGKLASTARLWPAVPHQAWLWLAPRRLARPRLRFCSGVPLLLRGRGRYYL